MLEGEGGTYCIRGTGKLGEERIPPDLADSSAVLFDDAGKAIKSVTYSIMG